MSQPTPGGEHLMRPLGHQPALDGLRGVAVLAVIGGHAFAFLTPAGYAGVDIFFTLSGFLITCLLVEEHTMTKRIRFGAFYMRRVLRLVPALVLVLLAYVLFCLLFYQGWERKAGVAGAAVALTYMSNWCRAFRLLPLGALNHTWSLAVEEQFYLVWPVLLLLVLHLTGSRRRALVAVAGLAAFFVVYRDALTYAGASGERLYNGLDTRADALLIGCCTALIYNTGLVRPGGRGGAAVGVAGGLAFLALLSYFTSGIDCFSRGLFYGGYTLLALCSALVILAVSCGFYGCRSVSWVLRRPALVWVGKLSYGLYLWHFVMLNIHVEALANVPPLIVAASAVVLAFVIASASYYWVEKPFLRMKGRFSSRTAAADLTAVPGGAPAPAPAPVRPRPVVVTPS
jgi:peptidoglycan/LPS O-acetylase OafA/YrhL